MKEIKFSGVEVKDRLLAKIVGGGEVRVFRISTGGILFETTDRLNINGHYKFQVTCDNKSAILAAQVRSVLLKSTVERKKRNLVLYQVVVDFEHLKDDEKAFLDAIIEQILESDIPTIHDGIRGAKIRVKE